MVGLLQPASREKTKTVAKDAPELLKLVEENAGAVAKQLKSAVLPATARPGHFKAYGSGVLALPGMRGAVRLTLCKAEFVGNMDALKELVGPEKAKAAAMVLQLFS